jgi:hypothetical protein
MIGTGNVSNDDAPPPDLQARRGEPHPARGETRIYAAF